MTPISRNEINALVTVFGILLIGILLLYGTIELLDYLENRHTEQPDVPTNDEPDKETLMSLVTDKGFKNLSPNIQKAIKEKLVACDMVPTTIEVTMSPSQLYKAGNPLWTKGIGIFTVASFYNLEEMLERRHAEPSEHLDEYLADRKQGMSIDVAQIKQLNKAAEKASHKRKE